MKPRRIEGKLFTTTEEIAAELERQMNESVCSETESIIEEEEIFSDDYDDSDLDPDYQFIPEDDEDEIMTNIKLSIKPPPQSQEPRTTEKAVPSVSGVNIHPVAYSKDNVRSKRKIGNHNNRESKRLKPNEDSILGRNGDFVWKTNSLNHGFRKTASKNVVHVSRKTKYEALDVFDPTDCFNAFFTREIMEAILCHTNEEINVQRQAYKNSSSSTLKDMSMLELRALIGITILAGAKKDSHINIRKLHDTALCGDRYNSVFSVERHNFLLNTLRFDSKETREERLKTDKLAPIRNIWDKLIDKCKSLFEPSAYTTIDEQLVPFRGRVGFKMFIPNKPAKYGIKIVMICDHGTNYMINAIPYLGKGTTPAQQPASVYFTEKLIETIKNSNRNITMDNWFTSIPLAQKLLNDYGLTMVGTVRKNKSEFPAEFVNPKYQDRLPGSSFFLFHKDVTAVSYLPRKNKLVSLISTMHNDDAVNDVNQKPEIILCYNQTKGSVDSFDQCVSNTSCNRKTKRWPMCMFYNMLNISSYNAFVVYLYNFFKKNKDGTKPLSRFDFLVKISDDLTFPWMLERLQRPHMPEKVRESIKRTLKIQDAPVIHEQQEQILKKKYCSFCSYKKRRMSKMVCYKCKKSICGEHSTHVCVSCK